MRKIIVLSYYFPPGNFAGSYRIESWANNLNKFGIHPIIITRHWNLNETDYTGLSAQKERSIKETEEYTLIKLPYNGSYRDRIVAKYGNKGKRIGKIFSFFQLIFQNIRIQSSPHHNLYFETKKVLRENPDIELIITSGKPFILFKYCHELKRAFPKLKWIADYRDPWNSEVKNFSLKEKFYQNIETHFERKWVKSASAITTVSEGIANGISDLLDFNKPITIIKNGFADYIKVSNNSKLEAFQIAYIGSLYPEQEIEVFLTGYKLFLEEVKPSNVLLNFYGLEQQPNQKPRIENFLRDYPSLYRFTKRYPKKELLEKASRNACLLICGMPYRKGTYTAKFMDYLALRKTILLCPSDMDVLENAVKQTNTGFILNSAEDVLSKLKELYLAWTENGFIPYLGNVKETDAYKNQNQISALAMLIKTHSNRNE